IHMNCACAALTVVTPLLGSGQNNCLANAVEQRRPRIDAKLVVLAVDAENNWNAFDAVPFLFTYRCRDALLSAARVCRYISAYNGGCGRRSSIHEELSASLVSEARLQI